MSKSIGRIAGTVGGFMVGGPAGAVQGYQLGSAIDKPGGGSSPSGQLNVTETPNTPAFLSGFQQNLFNRAQSTANQLGARQFAGFSGLQNQGFNALSGINQNAGMMGAQNALSRLSGMGNFTPERVNAGSFLTGDLSAYQNPYTQQVIDTTMSDIDRARQLQQQQVNAQALSRGAFGGSRQAIAEAENTRNFMDQQARTMAGLRQQGFNTAAELMQSDLNRALQAGQLNQAAGLQGQQLNLAAQEAALTGGLNLNRSFLGNAAAQIDAGAQQQALEQQRMDAARDLPLERLQILQSTLRGGQLPTGSTTSRPLFTNQSSGLLGSIGAFAANNPQAVSRAGSFLGSLPSMAQNAYYNWNANYGTPFGTSEGE